jgi:molybdate transport system substrate-binding protein
VKIRLLTLLKWSQLLKKENSVAKYQRNYLFLIFGFLFLLTGCNKNNPSESLFIYCAAGLKPAVANIAKEYSQKYHIDVQAQYGGSGTLLSNIRIAKRGDLYLAADESYIKNANEYGLTDEVQPVAYLKPVIAVKRGNPKNIKSLQDFYRPDINVAIANPDAASIGRQTQKMLTELGLWQSIRSSVKVLKPTVNDVANDIKIGSIDAGIIWDATANQYPDIEIVLVPEFENYEEQVTVAILKTTVNPAQTLSFIRYLTARDKGLLTFKDLGYNVIDGDAWEENPNILFYSGGVNRIAVENTIQAFEKREGVQVTRIYNGCGILVSQIKAGQKPDAYLTCDVSFMEQVETKFTEIENVSSTRIVIVTNKENTHNIQILADLSKNGLKIGVCNPDQSALGFLTANMLKTLGLYDSIMPNVRSQTPTADLLVNQIRTGSLDAVIVYEANTSQVKGKLNVIPIEKKEAFAIQNYGLGVNSDHKYLMRRFFKFITSEQSRQQYEVNGFEWQLSKSGTGN